MTDSSTEQGGAAPRGGIFSRIGRYLSNGSISERLPDAKAQLLFWGLLAGGLALDLWSKKAVFESMVYGESYTVVEGLLRLIPALNNGAAFGICAGQPFFLSAASVIAILIVLVYFYCSGLSSRLVHVALGMLAAGICGNLYDRVFNEGHVRDFIDVYINAFGRERHWHTFNVADALLCIGVGLLVIWTGSTGKSAQKHDPQPK